ncbi:MAG TPA: MBL fold metallo-hydrolase [Naasia sp.]
MDIVDVGHGSCVVVVTSDGVTVLDTGNRASLLSYLEREDIARVDRVLISHADQDHIGGLISMLDGGVEIGDIWLNPDASKRSAIWSALAYSLDDRQRRGGLLNVKDLGEGDAFDLGDEISATVLAPRLRLSLVGAGGRDRENRSISSNSLSGVVMLSLRGQPEVLVPGDLDWAGWQHLKASGVPLATRHLVLPHHGGSGGSPAQTAELLRELSAASQANFVYVSNGREGGYGNPRALNVNTVASTLPGSRWACTQLAVACAPNTPQGARADLLPITAKGRPTGSCCAGTIRLELVESELRRSGGAAHRSFIANAVPTPMCASLNR